MRRSVGIYEVLGAHSYRGHKPGTVFPAALNAETVMRAANRGNIRLLEQVGGDLPEGKYRLPKGWA